MEHLPEDSSMLDTDPVLATDQPAAAANSVASDPELASRNVASFNSRLARGTTTVKRKWPKGEFPIPDFSDEMDPVRPILDKAKSYYEVHEKPYLPHKGEKSILKKFVINCLNFEC